MKHYSCAHDILFVSIRSFLDQVVLEVEWDSLLAIQLHSNKEIEKESFLCMERAEHYNPYCKLSLQEFDMQLHFLNLLIWLTKKNFLYAWSFYVLLKI